MSKWITLKDLPGIQAGALLSGVVEHDGSEVVEGMDGYFMYATKHPDFFKRVEDEPEFVDVEIINNKGRLMVQVPSFCEFGDHRSHSMSIHALSSLPEFDGFVYEEGAELCFGIPRLSPDLDGDKMLPTHARFRRLNDN